MLIYIYRLTSPSQNVYIGKSNDFDKRMKSHVWFANKGLDYPICRAIRKYGFDTFQKEILFTVNEKLACDIEERLILFYKNSGNCYNVSLSSTSPGNVNKGRVLSEEHKEKLRKVHTGKKLTEEHKLKLGRKGSLHHLYGKHHTEEARAKISKNNRMIGKTGYMHHNAKSVEQLSLNGEFIKNWGSISDVYRDLGIDRISIGQCCKGKYRHAGGFKWRYV